MSRGVATRGGFRGSAAGPVALAAILSAAGALRFWDLGRLSFWYDEVVGMRLAQAGGPGRVLALLFQIDASRAPLHPLILSAWIRLLGSSETAARSLSVVCGLAAIVLVYYFGRAAFGACAGLWAAWLAATSPILVVYSREARMYAWLILATCAAWCLLLKLGDSRSWKVAAAYATALVALVYSHPLGLIMAAVIALAGLIDAERSFGGPGRWLAVHLTALAFVAPWLRYYVDHDPEFTSGRLSPRFLLGTPIGFVGGNFATQLVLVALIAWGVVRHLRLETEPLEPAKHRARPVHFLVIWLVAPPTLLYLYSLLFHPVFGPARYTAFSAPPYLLLVGLGLARCPARVRYPLALGLAVISGLALKGLAYDRELKADWRGFAARAGALASPRETLVVVVSADPDRNVEVETARYYLAADCPAITVDQAAPRLQKSERRNVFLVLPGRRGFPLANLPEWIGPFRFERDRRFELDGLIVYLGVRGAAEAGSSTGSASRSRS